MADPSFMSEEPQQRLSRCRITDKSGAVIWAADYDAYDKAITSNLRYPGQYWDAETGLHYNFYRYYDPEIGRYISTDPIGFSGGINIYTYARRNPLMFINSDGFESHLATCAAQCAADQLGMTDLIAAVGLGAGLPLIPKAMTQKVPLLVLLFFRCLLAATEKNSENSRWWAPTFKNWFLTTAKAGRFVGRWIPNIGAPTIINNAVQIDFTQINV
jgi:RHS repeat-associated protein